jgi:oligopeptidase A
MQNPLLQYDGLPQFSKIKSEHVKPAVEQQLKSNRELIDTLLDQNTTFSWENLIRPLEEAENQLEKLWSPVGHMNAVVNSNELRDAYNDCLPMLSEYHTELGQNKRLYDAIVAINETQSSLDDAQKKSLQDSIRGFKLSGVDLPEEKQQRYKEISQQLSQLSSRFSDNVLDATNAWTLQITDKSELAGLPDFALNMAEQAAKERDMEGWVFTLDFPSYYAIITYADKRELREKLYRAYTTKASDESEYPEYDNSKIMQEILTLREEKAQLLGFDNYAELSLDSKMADDPEKVISFLRELALKSKAYASSDFYELKDFAEKSLKINDLKAWDAAYVSEKLKQGAYGISDEDLKPYFPVDKVIEGMFTLVEKLYKIRIEEVKEGVDLWHDDVYFYQVKNEANEVIAEFYFDLYARQHKRGGAWMDSYRSRFHDGEYTQTPVAYMTCNSTPPIGNDPALFTHDDVETLFHEFGHGLHHMLTNVEYLDVSGISGVEWDAVELPSQFMENWCWEREALDMFAAHYQTGEKIPDELFEKMQASKNFQSGMMMVRQLEFALFDMLIHSDNTAKEAGNIANILQAVRDEVAVVQPPAFNRFENSFGHIFAGGYAAGYYSYKWAEVLSADAFGRFEEEGLFNPAVGEAFRQEVLEVGGSRPAIESFKAFRGREPSIEALLRHSGLQDKQAA